MTYHDASTRFGDRAHFPSMGSQLPKHIPGRARGYVCWRKARPTLTEIVDFEAHEIQDTEKWAQRSLGWGFVFCEENCLACYLLPRKNLGWWIKIICSARSSQRYIWYLFDCNLAKIFAWLNWPWLKSPMKITMFHQDFLQNFSGGDGEVEPFSAGDALVTIKALGGVFPRKFIRFLSSFRGFGFRIFQTKGS